MHNTRYLYIRRSIVLGLTALFMLPLASGRWKANPGSSLQSIDQVKPVAKGELRVTVDTPAKTVDLSAEGNLDWVHWGLIEGTTFVNRKNQASVKIGNLTKIGSREIHTYENNATGYSWSNGSPTGTAKTNSGIFIYGNAFGFQLSVPADASSRTLKLYVGAWNTTGKLEAALSDGSIETYTDTSVVSNGTKDSDIINRVYTITYQAASAGQTLTLKYTNTGAKGNVELQAATLSR